MKKITFVILSLFVLTIAAPFFTVSAASAAEKEVINVAAASSFSYALNEIKEGFEARGGVKVRLIFGSSGMLARQIQADAPFDVFISANRGFMERLVTSGAVRPDDLKKFAGGVLVLASHRGAGDEISNLKGLLDKKIRRVAIANPRHAPYGRAAVEALKKAGLFERIRKKLVYGENVRQALQFIESGNVEAGFIALSIAQRKGIRAVPVDPALYTPIEQTVAVVKATAHGHAAKEFVDYLTGADGMRILQKYGFITP